MEARRGDANNNRGAAKGKGRSKKGVMNERSWAQCTRCKEWMYARSAGVVGWKRERVESLDVLECRKCVLSDNMKLVEENRRLRGELSEMRQRQEGVELLGADGGKCIEVGSEVGRREDRQDREPQEAEGEILSVGSSSGSTSSR